MSLPDGVFALDGYEFGGSGLYPVFVRKFDPGTIDWDNQDTPNPQGHNIMFGRDHMRPPMWTFDFGAARNNEVEVLDALDDLASVWAMPNTRNVPGKEMRLYYGRGGRTRFVYGRPRRFSHDVQPGHLRYGAMVGLAEFKLSDVYHYEEDEQSTPPLLLFAAQAGGLTTPLTTPLTTVSWGTRQGIIANTGGSAPTPFRVVFSGAITNPFVTGDGWKVGLNYTMTTGESITIDTRDGSVTRNDGADLRGFLTNDSRMADAKLKLGPEEFQFGGVDLTGNGTAVVKWNRAHNGF